MAAFIFYTVISLSLFSFIFEQSMVEPLLKITTKIHIRWGRNMESFEDLLNMLERPAAKTRTVKRKWREIVSSKNANV